MLPSLMSKIPRVLLIAADILAANRPTQPGDKSSPPWVLVLRACDCNGEYDYTEIDTLRTINRRSCLQLGCIDIIEQKVRKLDSLRAHHF
jgi:hypothetical protein